MAEQDQRLVRLPLNPTDEEILSVVRDWCKVLEAEDYDQALAMVRAPDYWTPELLKEVINSYNGYASDGEYYTISSLTDAKYRPGDEPVNNPWPRHEVDRYPENPEFLGVWFDLPLNGYWSDLTATFSVDIEGDHRVLTLEQVHVM